MKKYIAGFRSNNIKNKKKASIYYFLITLFFLLGKSKKINDILLYSLLLSTPSLFYNFKSFIKKVKNKRKRKVFVSTLICYIITLVTFLITTPDIKEVINTSSILSEALSKYNKNYFKNNSEYEKVEGNAENLVDVYEAQIHFIDTGNSDAILIRQGGKAALIDGGDNDDEESVVTYLKDIGVKELEYIIATHPDADHIGGLDAVINSIPVKNIYISNGRTDTKTYTDFINSMANKGLYPSVPLLGSEFNLGTSKFKVLSAANLKNLNDNSLVLEYTNGNDKILFMGDAGQDIERIINVGQVDLIKISHHGSNTSSNESFIKKVNPEYAVITVGKNNRYNHPNKETMSILQKQNIEVHRSDECGHILFKSTGNGLIVNCEDGSYSYGG